MAPTRSDRLVLDKVLLLKTSVLSETFCVSLAAKDSARILHVEDEGTHEGCATGCEYGQDHQRAGPSCG